MILKEKKGILLTMRKLNISIEAKRGSGEFMICKMESVSVCVMPMAMDAKNIPVAGVGNPTKELFCSGSMLNLARRMDANAAIKNAAKGIMLILLTISDNDDSESSL